MQCNSLTTRSLLLSTSALLNVGYAAAQPAPPAEAPAAAPESQAPPPPEPSAAPAEMVPTPLQAPPPEPAPSRILEAPANSVTPSIPSGLAVTPALMPEVVAPVAPQGPPPIALQVGGSIWTRYEVRAGYAEHGLTHPRLHREGDYLVSRARLALKTVPVEVQGLKVSATFAPQAAYTWGENTGATPTVSDHPQLALYEGYASVASSVLEFSAGRFAMNYGDALVIGDLGWNEAARAFNGARFRVTPGKPGVHVDAFATLIAEGRTTTLEAFEGDSYFYGIYAMLGPAITAGLELDAYLLGHSTAGSETVRLDSTDPTVTGDLDSATELTLGLRVKGKAGIADFRAEGGIQGGARPVAPSLMARAPSSRSKFAAQIDAELGVAPLKGFRVGVEGLYATGDDLSTPDEDEGYNELYPTTHKFLGWMDIIGTRTNIASGVLHVAYAASDALKLALDAHYFYRPEANAAGRDGSVGSELNLNAAYSFGGGAAVRGMYGIFLADEDFWTAGAAMANDAGDPLHFFELQFGYEFK